MNLAALTLHVAGEKLRAGEITSTELTEAVFQRIAASDEQIHAYLTLDREGALDQARRADARLRAKDGDAPLLGIPMALKDNFLTQGLRTTAATKILGDFIP
ncbi:MAG TPA: amidase family protein, partial [Candidatus Binatia bacterium]